MLKQFRSVLIVITVMAVVLTGGAGLSSAQEKKFKVYLDLSITGGGWITAATNAIKALAATPPYDKLVDLQVVISGTDAQRQISDYESMITAGADAVVSMPISFTALDRTVRRGCDKGVLFFMFENTVAEPCAYQVTTVSSGYGENGMQYLVNLLHGKGNIFFAHVAPGVPADKRHFDGAMSVMKKYPGMKIIAEYYTAASDEQAQVETEKALAAHPDVDGVFSQPGELGVLKAFLASRPDRLVPIVGESSNGFRLALANPDLQERGFRGLSSGGTPAAAAYAFKLMMELLTKQRSELVHHIQIDLPWVPADAVRICTGDRVENGCNAFPPDKVPDTFNDAIFSPLLPELSLTAVLEGKPTPGATIQKLTNEIVPQPDTPGLNCLDCTAPPDLYRLTKVEPTVMP